MSSSRILLNPRKWPYWGFSVQEMERLPVPAEDRINKPLPPIPLQPKPGFASVTAPECTKNHVPLLELYPCPHRAFDEPTSVIAAQLAHRHDFDWVYLIHGPRSIDAAKNNSDVCYVRDLSTPTKPAAMVLWYRNGPRGTCDPALDAHVDVLSWLLYPGLVSTLGQWLRWSYDQGSLFAYGPWYCAEVIWRAGFCVRVSAIQIWFSNCVF